MCWTEKRPFGHRATHDLLVNTTLSYLIFYVKKKYAL